jgi:ankyrin repeat protein/beta-lactamase regulating signal transducer with metallopeptidase domain
VPTWLTDGSQAVVCAAVAFLVHSTVLIALGLLLTVRSRRRNAAFRRTILRITVVAVLVSPVAGALHRHSGSTRTVAQLPTAPALMEAPLRAEVSRVQGHAAAWPGSFRVAVQGSRSGPAAVGAVRPRAAAARVAGGEGSRGPTARPHVAERRYDVFYVGIAAVLVLGVAALTFRLARVYARLVRASRRAEPAPAGVQGEYERAARAAKAPVPRVLVSRAVRSPLVMGVVRPAVLLPAGAGDEGVACSRAIVLHELAHLRHRDCLWGLLVQVLCVVAPWQPLVWVLARRLGGCQEEACDDYVVWLFGRRREYARELVRVAQVYGVVQQASLAVAGAVGYRSRLGRRVSRVLDATRRASPGVRAATVLVLLALGGVVLFATGVLDVGLLWQVPQEVAVQAMKLARAGDSAGLTSLVEEHRGLLKREGTALLVGAAGKGHVEACRLLLDRGVNPDRAVNEITALYSAASGGHEEVVSLLLGAGADPSARVVGGRTALQVAAGRGHVDVVHTLLAERADADAQSEKGMAPIHAAASQGETECLRVLLEHGADLALRDEEGRTALHYACAAPDTAALSLLLDAGAAVEAADNGGRTALHEAVGSGRTAKGLFLLGRGADANARTHAGETPLHGAAATGHVVLAHALLEAGADVNARDEKGRTPLGSATPLPEPAGVAMTPLPQMQRFLLANGAEYDAISAVAFGSPADVERVVGPAESAPVYTDGSTLLHAAVVRGNRGMVKVLLGKGFDPAAADSEGQTPVDLAMERNDIAMADLLLPGRSLPAASATPTAAPTPAPAAAEGPPEQRTAGQAAEDLLREGREAIAPIIAPLRGTARPADAAAVATAGTPAAVAVSPASAPVRAVAAVREAPVLAAVRAGDVAALRQVLEAGADPDETGAMAMALEAGNPVVVRVLLEAGAELNVRDDQGMTPLHRTVTGSDAETLQLLLEHGADVDARNPSGVTPLLAAVSAGAEAAVEVLLAAGADPNAADNTGRVPLEAAVAVGPGGRRIRGALQASGGRHTIFSALRCGALEDARRLLEEDPSLAGAEDAEGLTPLCHAVRTGDNAAVRMLLEAGVSPDTRERATPAGTRDARARSGGLGGGPAEAPADTPLLMVAIRTGNQDVVEVLLEAGADARSCRSDGLAPLHMAARARRVGMVATLAAAGADPNADGGLGWRPLHEATARPDGAALQGALAAVGADVNARDAYGRSALRYAVEEERLQNAQALLGLGAEHDLLTAAAMGNAETIRRLAAEDPRGLGLRSASLATPLHVAAERGDAEVIGALLEAGADPNASDLSGRSPLHLAAATGNVEAVVELLDGGANADMPTNVGSTPLHVAAEGGRAKGVQGLPAAHEGPIAVTAARAGPVGTASAQEAGAWQVVQALLEAGANPATKDERGRSPLHVAAGAGDVRTVGLLLDGGADPDCLADSGATPLVAASQAGAWDVVQVLLGAGADPRACERFGSSPLYIAVKAGDLAAASALLEAGAEADSSGQDAATGEGGTALHAAVSLGRLDIVQLLLDGGADPLMAAGRGQTVLHAAARGKRADVAAALLDAGVPLDLVDSQGYSALHHAVATGAMEVAELLRERGARHDAFTATAMRDPVALRNLLAGEPRRAAVQTLTRATALHLAAATGNVEAARLLADALIRAGVGLEQVNRANRTAREVAAEEGHDEVVQVLDAARARLSAGAAPGPRDAAE